MTPQTEIRQDAQRRIPAQSVAAPTTAAPVEILAPEEAADVIGEMVMAHPNGYFFCGSAVSLFVGVGWTTVFLAMDATIWVAIVGGIVGVVGTIFTAVLGFKGMQSSNQTQIQIARINAAANRDKDREIAELRAQLQAQGK